MWSENTVIDLISYLQVFPSNGKGVGPGTSL